MYTRNSSTVKKYLAELVEGGDFTDIPMREDVWFTGPLASATTSRAYRSICEDCSESVREISIRTMVGDDDVVHVVYDLDLGSESGWLPISQTVAFADGAFASVEVIFDAAAITGAAS